MAVNRMSEKAAGAAMSGALLTFGKVFSKSGGGKTLNIGQFSNEIVRFGRGVGALSRSMYYFVPDGPNAGGGRLTAGMAANALIYIKKMIAGDRAGYKGPPIVGYQSEHYRDWKSKVPKFAGRPVMYLTGSTADSLGVLRNSSGGVVIGIRSNFFVEPPMVGTGVGGRKLLYGKRIRVRDYAIRHEMGLGVPQRPIISGAMASWISETSSDWAEAFNSIMYQTFWSELQQRDPSEVEESFITTDRGQSISTTQVAQDLIQLAEYAENSSKKISDFARKLVTMTATGAKGSSLDPKQAEIVRKTLRKELTGGGLTASEVEDIINTALTGRMPNFKMYRDN